MKKIFSSLILFAVMSYYSFGQSPDQVIGKAFYSFEHVIDTNHRDKPHKENMGLYLAKNASLYASMDNLAEMEKLESSIRQQMAENGGQLKSLNIKRNAGITRDQIYYFAGKDQLFTEKRLISNYLIEEPKYNIDWQLTQDTLNIAGMICYKATANFRGRHWTAWYNPELPFHAGPWKLHGLPGLIVEARDDRGEVSFSFNGFETVKPQEEQEKKSEISNNGNVKIEITKPFNELEIKLPENGVRTTAKEFAKLQAARDKDPQGFYQTQITGSGGSVRVVAGKKSPSASGPVVKMNNPIELSDQ